MNASTVPNTGAPVDSAARNLRVCREHMLGCAAALDVAGMKEAHHSLLLSLTSLDDCLAALEHPGQFGDHRDGPSLVDPVGDTIADDRRDDLMMDADRNEYR